MKHEEFKHGENWVCPCQLGRTDARCPAWQAEALRQNLPGEEKRRFKHRATLKSLPGVYLEYIREGDALVVTCLDRLARSTLHLCQIAAELGRKCVDLRVLDQNINTADATGRLLSNMLGAIGQFETELRAERQKDGIQKAKERGVQFGERKKLSPEQGAELQKRRQEGVLIKTLMKEYDLSKSSVYRYLNKTISLPGSDS